jgi:antitoxin component YwqK of YwqJK toxin-antitoxin module
MYNREKIEYRVGQVVVPYQYDANISKVCSGGIHYFLTPEPAYFYEKQIDVNFSGKIKKWHDNGVLAQEAHFTDGKRNGRYTIYYEFGLRSEECVFVNGVLNGTHVSWDCNGDKIFEHSYKNGKLNGKWIGYDRRREFSYRAVRTEIEFVNGVQIGWRTKRYDDTNALISMHRVH